MQVQKRHMRVTYCLQLVWHKRANLSNGQPKHYCFVVHFIFLRRAIVLLYSHVHVIVLFISRTRAIVLYCFVVVIYNRAFDF
jgi:hypothetical protein